jgi:hypothetical protein
MKTQECEKSHKKSLMLILLPFKLNALQSTSTGVQVMDIHLYDFKIIILLI